MKIVLISHYFPPHVGGIEYVAQNQAKYLAKKGHDVSVITSAIGTKKGRHKDSDGYTVFRIAASNMMEKKTGVPFPIFSPKLLTQTYRLVKQADIVHVHDAFYVSSQISGIVSIIMRKPFYITQHVATVDHPSRLVMFVQKTIYHTLGKLLFNKSKGIIVYNVNVKNFLIKLGVDSRKILQNYNGIDTTFFSPIAGKDKNKLKTKYNFPIKKPVVLFVGRLVPKKGFDLVFNARANGYTTLIVGGGKIPKYMLKADNVIFFGTANKKQLQELYRVSDLLVLPSLGEVFTLVMQEAMSCGLPIITTDDTGYLDYDIRHHLIGFTNRKTDVIKSKIFQVLKNDNLRKEMSDYSRELSLERFSWEKNYSKEFSLYKLGSQS